MKLSNEQMAWIESLRQDGWQDEHTQQGQALQLEGDQATAAVAGALLGHWAANPTLENYAVQVNGASRLFAQPEDRRQVIMRMNDEYIAKRQLDMPHSLADCYAELSFWDGLDTPEVNAYTAALRSRFAALVAEAQRVGPEMVALLASRELSPALRQLRKQSVEALRNGLKARLNRQRMPQERMLTLLGMATGIGGARIVDAALWQQAQAWTKQAADAGGNSYFHTRDALLQAADGNIAEKPRETLDHIHDLLDHLDQRANYGAANDPALALGYWRGRQFEGIPDSALLAVYENALTQNPSAQSQLLRDLPLLQGRAQEAEFRMVLGGAPASPAAPPPRQGDEPAFWSAGMDIPVRKIVLTVLVIVALALLLGITWVLRQNSKGNTTPSPSPSSTLAPTQPPSDPPAQHQDTPAPTQPSPPPPTASPSPSPTQQPPSPSPSLDPTPALPPEGDTNEEEGLIESEGDEDIPFEDEVDEDVEIIN